MSKDAIRSQPCAACPYRRDVPSGVWSRADYEKLRDYDEPTTSQPPNAFACHATPEHLCHGWAVCHSNRGHGNELLALRFGGNPEIPESTVELFTSGNEAADHGERDIDGPSDEAIEAAQRLVGKYERLREPS